MTSKPLSSDDLREIFRRIPALRTERLLLRRCMRRDAADMYEYSCRRDTTEYLLWSPHKNQNDSERLIRITDRGYKKGREYVWSIVLLDRNGAEQKMIGTVCFTKIVPEQSLAEIGYVLSPDYCGQGYGREAVRTLLRFGFDILRMERIEARIMYGNDASAALAEAVGMRREGTLRSLMNVKGIRRDIMYFSILREEFYNGQ